MRILGHGLLALAGAVLTFAATALAVVLGPAWVSAGTSTESLTWQGVPHSYRVYRPAAHPARPGLVLDLHPSAANGFLEQATSRLDGYADRDGWLVAYPDSPTAWTPYGTSDGPDETPFLGALIDRLTASDGVDPARVYVVGLSRGGMMAYRVACELAPRVTAVAVVAGNLADARGDAGGTGCHPARPVSVLAIHGTADRSVPFAGGGRFAPFGAVVSTWRNLDRCAGAGVGTGSTTTWACAGGSAVRATVVAGAGHTWPGTPFAGPPWGAAESFDASAAVAAFFAEHSHA